MAESLCQRYCVGQIDLAVCLWKIVLALAANGDQGSNSLNIDPNYNVVRWSSSEATSQWTITCVGKDETPELITNLTNLIEKTDNLVKQAGTIETARETVM